MERFPVFYFSFIIYYLRKIQVMYGAETDSHFKSKASNACMFKGKKTLRELMTNAVKQPRLQTLIISDNSYQ